MKRVLSFAIFAGLFLVLGVMAFMARPSGDVAEAGNQDVVAGAAVQQEANAPEAPQAPTANKYNFVALPLDTSSTITNAASLGASIPGSTLILNWNASAQLPQAHPIGTSSNNFSTFTGGAYLVQVDSSAEATFTLVGDVPPQTTETGAVQFTLYGDTPCEYNWVSVPLDHGGIITNASSLAASVGDVQLVLNYNASGQIFQAHPVGTSSNNFAVEIGHPYMLCMTADKTWPTTAP